MTNWTRNHRVVRAVLVCASIAAFAVSSGAGVKWGAVRF
jgi:hypothetical protein